MSGRVFVPVNDDLLKYYRLTNISLTACGISFRFQPIASRNSSFASLSVPPGSISWHHQRGGVYIVRRGEFSCSSGGVATVTPNYRLALVGFMCFRLANPSCNLLTHQISATACLSV